MTEKSILIKREKCAAKNNFFVIKNFVTIHLDIVDLVF